MFDARFQPPGAAPRKLRAEDYEEGRHKGHVLCGDFNCQARLHYRSQSMRFGNVVYRMPHFVTFAGSKHIDGCTHFNPSTEEKALRRIPEALAAGKNILVNINMDLGLPSVEGADPRDTSTLYGRFVAKSNHLAVSVKSASDLLRVRDTLVRAGGEEALARAYAGHQLDIRRFENVFIGDDKKKLRTLFTALARGEGAIMRGPQAQVTGFPRLFLFRPTENTVRHGTRAAYINGTSQYLSGKGADTVILVQSLGLHDVNVRRDILEGRQAYVLAVPVFNPAAVVIKGGKKQQRLSWAIANESQYIAEAPQPKLL